MDDLRLYANGGDEDDVEDLLEKEAELTEEQDEEDVEALIDDEEDEDDE